MNTMKMTKMTTVRFGLLALILAGAGLGVATAVASHSPSSSPAPPPSATRSVDAASGRALLEQFSAAFQDAAEHVNPSVVPIFAEQEVQVANVPFGPDLLRRFFDLPGMPGGEERPVTRKAKSLGSGVIVSEDGYILTNNHVVRDATKLTVELEGEKHAARVVGVDPQTDLAVIKVDAKDLPAAKLGDSDGLRVGQWVIAVGNPLELLHSVTAGIVSAKGRSEVGVAAYENFIQTDASINYGNSGGALADLDGNVVGINTAIATPTGGSVGLGFAIPINMARGVMDELIAKGRVQRGYLALMPQDLDENLAAALGLKDRHGALVGEVTADGPADKAGVKRGDVIVSFNGQPVADATALRNLVGTADPASAAKLGVVRDGKERQIEVRLGERPDEVAENLNSGDEQGPGGSRLGLSVQPLTPDLASRLGYENAHGVVVREVEPGSPADEAGIRRGDLIEAVGPKDVTSVTELKKALEGEGKHVALLVRRGDRPAQYIGVELS